MPRLSPLTLITLALLALLGLGLYAHSADAATGPYMAYLPATGCAGCTGSNNPPPPSPTATPSPSVYASRMIQLINQQRATVGCPALVPHNALMRGAQAWSEKMARESFAAHTPADYYAAFGYPNGGLENIGSGETPEYAFEGMMESPPHRRNVEWCYHPDEPIYDPSLVYDVGVGYAWPGYWTLVINVR